MSLLVASTTPVALSLPSQLHSSEAICQVVVNSPWALVRAHVGCSTTFASILSGHVGDWVVGLVAGLNGLVDRGLSSPPAGALAAVPISGGSSG
jgi:hypothetical protein